MAPYAKPFPGGVEGVPSSRPASQRVELTRNAVAAREVLVNLADDGSDLWHAFRVAGEANSAGALRAGGLDPQWASRYQSALADDHLAPQLLPHAFCRPRDSSKMLDTTAFTVLGHMVLEEL